MTAACLLSACFLAGTCPGAVSLHCTPNERRGQRTLPPPLYSLPAANIGLMMVAGFFVNGPYALITTSVSADLGTHDSLAGGRGGRGRLLGVRLLRASRGQIACQITGR